ncbi:MAG: hypothetical protein D6788_05245 [Planctomycetota bacterium]|nr:MAG: hypothetical protein D6788_05245 [Planctomycetota bacterium]
MERDATRVQQKRRADAFKKCPVPGGLDPVSSTARAPSPQKSTRPTCVTDRPPIRRFVPPCAGRAQPFLYRPQRRDTMRTLAPQRRRRGRFDAQAALHARNRAWIPSGEMKARGHAPRADDFWRPWAFGEPGISKPAPNRSSLTFYYSP